LHAKLDAQIAVEKRVDNRVIGAESLPEVEIKRLQAEAVEQVKETMEDVVDR
jgi:low affinity Fe/Cu permease